MDEIVTVFQSMIQTTSSNLRSECVQLQRENFLLMIRENPNAFQRVCAVIKSIQTLKDIVEVYFKAEFIMAN